MQKHIPELPKPSESTDLLVLQQRQRHFKIWAKTIIFSYNMLFIQQLSSPSFTIQWFPQNNLPKQFYTTNKILHATSASSGQQNYLIVSKLKFPTQITKKFLKAKKSRPKQIIQPYAMIKHEGEINKARYNPLNPQLVASKSSNGSVYVHNYIHHSKEGKLLTENYLRLELVGHDQEGFGLCWDHHKNGVLLSGGNDGKVLLWDLNRGKQIDGKNRDKVVSFSGSFEGNECSVNDVIFHKFSTDFFATGDDKGYLNFYDRRVGYKPVQSNIHHQGEIYSIDFSQSNMFRYITGGSDNLVLTWDMRRNTKPEIELKGHGDSITKVEFSSLGDNIIWSSSSDGKLIKWDLSSDNTELLKNKREQWKNQYLKIKTEEKEAKRRREKRFKRKLRREQQNKQNKILEKREVQKQGQVADKRIKPKPTFLSKQKLQVIRQQSSSKNTIVYSHQQSQYYIKISPPSPRESFAQQPFIQSFSGSQAQEQTNNQTPIANEVKTKTKKKSTTIPRYSKQCKFVHWGSKGAFNDFSVHPLHPNRIIATDDDNMLHLFDPVWIDPKGKSKSKPKSKPNPKPKSKSTDNNKLKQKEKDKNNDKNNDKNKKKYKKKDQK